MKKLLPLLIFLILSSCYAYDDMSGNGRYRGHYKVGNPYEIAGTMYFPEENTEYEEEGVASWYGNEFHSKATANGERYNQYAMTAAHRTLPLPSMVKVTNLENGEEIIVKVNDRGPFAKERIIDLSKKAAQKLGMIGKGTANVKVEYLKEETDMLHFNIFGRRMADAN
jgi:rare lipoprotein A